MERKRLLALAAATAFGAAMSATAAAQLGGTVQLSAGAEIDFSAMDKDNDGQVSKAEASGNKEVARQFDQLDADKNGRLSEGEFAKLEMKGEQKREKGGYGEEQKR